MGKVYCKNCLRWYSAGTDHCGIPDCGVFEKEDFNKAVGKKESFDIEGYKFIKSHMPRIYGYAGKELFGHPSQLNKNNDCYFYKALPECLRWLTPIARMFAGIF